MSEPSEEPLVLPLVRIKRIIKQDLDVHGVSSTAVYAVSAATKLFVTHMTEQALFAARGSGRTRLTYADMANAVARNDELTFLSSVVPKTQTYFEVAQKRTAAELPLATEIKDAPPEQMEPEDGDDQPVPAHRGPTESVEPEAGDDAEVDESLLGDIEEADVSVTGERAYKGSDSDQDQESD